MKQINRFFSFLVTMLLMVGIFSSSIFNVQAESATDVQSEGEVTRLEWLKALTEAFQMQVDESNYPDNYYSDIDASSEDYYDIMLATEFGLIDVEAGDALRPDDAATREFVAHTLNLCMGYIPEEGTEYTFSEADTVQYPEDIQISINKGWIELVDGDFLPEQGITVAEKERMIAAAEAAVASVVVDADYDSQYQFAEGVVVVPEGTEVVLTDENELTFYDCATEISEGDIFVVFSDGYPVPRRAVSVTDNGSETIITVESVEAEEAFISLEARGTIGADLAQVQAVDDTVQLAYIVGGTESQGYEDGVTLYSLEEVEDEKEITAVIATKTIQPVSKLRSAADDMNPFSISCKITNVSADYGVSIANGEAFFNVSAKVSVSVNTKFIDTPISSDFVESFVKIPIGVVGYFKPEVEGKINGTVGLAMKGNLTTGVQWNAGQGVRLIGDFKKESFTIQIKVEGKIGVRVAIGADVGFLKAELFAEAGVKASAKRTTYTDFLYPEECIHVTAHLYASAGGEVTFKLIIFKTKVTLEKEFITEKNSPVRVALHYDDGKPVSCCARDSISGDGGSSSSGSGSSGLMGGALYKYYTPIDSQYAYSGANTGISSTGEPYTIFEYSLDDSKQATITKYNGNVSVLNIPDTIDGYTVVGIGSRVFQNNARLMMVNMPDTVTEIGEFAFSYCTNLMDVTLSHNLKTMGGNAFQDCDALTNIEIPKSLRSTIGEHWYGGIFRDCDNLKTVTIEKGITAIPLALFSGCTGLEEIVIPDTVTIIEESAFSGCINLKQVTIPSSVTIIDGFAFSNCESLSDVVIPDSVQELGLRAFENCSSLSNVYLSKTLISMNYNVFKNCDSLTSIEIPKSLKGDFTGNDAFENCDNLGSVTFEEGTTEIAGGLFGECTGLEEIVIPDSVTKICSGAFENCLNLKKVDMPSSLTQIGDYSFAGCESLVKVIVPNSVTSIGDSAFSDCSNLSAVYLSKSLKSMGYHAFFSCDALTSIEIPKSLNTTDGPFDSCDNLKTITFEDGTTKVAQDLFIGCTGLEEVVIPDTVTVIGYEAFRDCINLKNIILPDGLIQIGRYAFYNCNSLLEVSIPDSVTWIGDYTFSYCTSLQRVKLSNKCNQVTTDMFLNCTSLTTVKLPDAVTTIGMNSFANSGLTTITLPTKLESIGENAFNNCDSLQSISIPDSVTTIGTYCFADCEVLSDVQLGSGLTQISSYTFNLCPSLEKVVLPYRMSTVAANAFTNCTKLKELTVPRTTSSIASNAFSYPTQMTVYGVPGTYAEEWADAVGATFVSQEKPATAVTLSETALTLNKGKTANLVLTVTPADFTDEITWKSSNETVATVSDAGVITAKAVGSATIRVTVGNVSASCKVTVVQPVTSISLNKTTLSMEAETTYALSATVSPSTANDKTVTWSSSDESVATVNQNGTVTAHKKGTAVITATANDGSGVYRTCTVTVTNTLSNCDSVDELESPHNYENNCNDVWIYTIAGVKQISVTFDERTAIEDEFDFLYLYDSAGNEIGKYTGTELAGQTIIIDGDTIKLKLISDSSGNAWGFKVTNAEEYCEHSFASDWSGDDTYHWHGTTCGHESVMQDKEEHTVGKWIVDQEATTEAAGSRHKECIVCGRTLATEEIEQLVDHVKELEERLDTAVTLSVEAASGLTAGNYEQASPEEKLQAVENVLEQIWTACEEQNIKELGILPVDTAEASVSRMTAVEQQISSLLGTSVTVVAKQEQQAVALSEVQSELPGVSSGDALLIQAAQPEAYTELGWDLPAVKNALLSVPAGDAATIQVAQVETPVIEGVDTSNAMAITMELYSENQEKLSLKVPVIVTMSIPDSIDTDEDVVIYHFPEGSSEYTEMIPAKVDNQRNTLTFVTGSFSTFVVLNAPEGTEISGTVTVFGDADTRTTIQLLHPDGTVAAETMVTGNSAYYLLTDVAEGTYTIRVSKQNHVTRTYSVSVGEDPVQLDVKIQLLGDVTGDGVINVRDKKQVYNHIAGTIVLEDYTFLVGDVTGDGVINVRDKKSIYNHIAGTGSLWE